MGQWDDVTERTERNKIKKIPKRKRKRRITPVSVLKDIISLAIVLSIAYLIYGGGYFGHYYMKAKSMLEPSIDLAASSIDDRAIEKHIKYVCKDIQAIECDLKSIKIKRDFEKATINFKYKLIFKPFFQWPVKDFKLKFTLNLEKKLY